MKFLIYVLCALAALIAAPPVLAQTVPTEVPAPFKVGAKATQAGKMVTLPLTQACPRHATLWLITGTGVTDDDLVSVVASTGNPNFTRGTRVAAQIPMPPPPDPAPAIPSINMAWTTDLPQTMAVESTITVTWDKAGAHEVAAACIPSPPGFLVSLDHEDVVPRAAGGQSPLATTGELGQWANELALFAVGLIDGYGDDWTKDVLATPGDKLDPPNGPMVLRWAWARANPDFTTTSTAALTYTPRNSMPRYWMTKAITFRIKPLYGYQYDFDDKCPNSDPEECYKKAIREFTVNNVTTFKLYRIGADNNALTPDALASDMGRLPSSTCALLNLKNKFHDNTKKITGIWDAEDQTVTLDNVTGLYAGLLIINTTNIPNGTVVKAVGTNSITFADGTVHGDLGGGQSIEFTSGGKSVKPANDSDYRTQIKTILSTYNTSAGQKICAVTIENEEGSGYNVQQYIDGGGGVPAIPTEAQLGDPTQSQAIGEFTADLLLNQMRQAATAVHESNAELQAIVPDFRPVVVAPGGIASSGVEFYTWFKLWNNGSGCASDDFRAKAYADYAYQGVTGEGDKTIQLPNCDYPNRNIFGNDPEMLRELYQTVRLVDGMYNTGMDCGNVHLFAGRPDIGPQLEATRMTLAAFKLPYADPPPPEPRGQCSISDAIGQKNNTPTNEQGLKASVFTGMGVADVPAYLGLKIANLFGAPPGTVANPDNALPVIDPDTGELNGFGCGVRDTWTDLDPSDADNNSWIKHRARRGDCFADLDPGP